jgi:hypothetical protein
MKCSVLVGDRDYWRSGKDGEYAIDKKLVAVQGSFLLGHLTITNTHTYSTLRQFSNFSAFFTTICNLTLSLYSHNYPVYLNGQQLN